MSRTRTAAVGAFVVGGLLLFVVALFRIGDRRLLFVDQFELVSTFGKVTGLEVGTVVRVAGLDAGEVLDIQIPARPSDRFRVRMRLRDDLRQLVRTDSVSTVLTDGIVGNAFIQISPGSDGADVVAPGGTIAGQDPIEFADLIQEGRDTFRTVSAEFIDLKGDVSVALDALNTTVLNANAILTDVGGDARRLAARSANVADDLGRVMSDVKVVVSDIRGGKGTIGQLLNDDALYTRVKGAAEQMERTAANVQGATDRARQLVDRFTAPDGPGTEMLGSLRTTLVETEELVSDLSESAEALKRNFLFRGFFRDRGFFDLDTLSPDRYRRGALEGDDRTALRIWLEADLLFARDAEGRELLTESGKRRLESAMIEFGRYPRNSPLVVEGYAERGGTTPRDVRAAARAELVREFLQDRYRRRSTLTGSLVLNDAPDSPHGDGQWSGVALALFVPNDAITR